MSFKTYAGQVVIKPIDGAYVSVTEYGAVGDGVADDTQAIQAALDSKQSSGGTIYFPAKTYKVTSSIFFYSNQYLLFEKGAKLLQGDGIDNLLMSYCPANTEEYNGAHDCVIDGAIFDGGTYEVSNTLVGTVHAKNIVIKNCTFLNAYGSWHNLEINSTCNAKVINCEFDGSRKTSSYGCLIQIDAIATDATWPWPDNRGVVDSTPCKNIEIANCVFRNCAYAPGIGNHSSATAFLDVRIHNNFFDNITSGRGCISFRKDSFNCKIINNIYSNCQRHVGDVPAGTIDSEPLLDELMILSDLVVHGSHTFSVDNFEPGTWSYSSKSSSDVRLRSSRLFKVKPGMTITYINPSFKVFFGPLASEDASAYVSGGSGWLGVSSSAATYTIPSGTKFLNIILETPDGTTAADLSDYDCTISISLSS